MAPRALETFTAEEALARIADVAKTQTSIRSRIEGMTWVIWGLIAALQAMTLGFLDQTSLAATTGSRHFTAIASHLWIVIGIAASVGIWRAAAVNFDPGIGRQRALAFFIGWPTLFTLASYLIAGFGGGAFRLAFVTAILLLAFALVNPVRYTPRGRWTAGVLALVAFGVALVSLTYGAPDNLWFVAAGAAIGLSWVLAGLFALYRG